MHKILIFDNTEFLFSPIRLLASMQDLPAHAFNPYNCFWILKSFSSCVPVFDLKLSPLCIPEMITRLFVRRKKNIVRLIHHLKNDTKINLFRGMVTYSQNVVFGAYGDQNSSLFVYSLSSCDRFSTFWDISIRIILNDTCTVCVTVLHSLYLFGHSLPLLSFSSKKIPAAMTSYP